jgi:hypothetical protein
MGHGTWTLDLGPWTCAWQSDRWKPVSEGAASATATELPLVHDSFWNCMGLYVHSDGGRGRGQLCNSGRRGSWGLLGQWNRNPADKGEGVEGQRR